MIRKVISDDQPLASSAATHPCDDIFRLGELILKNESFLLSIESSLYVPQIGVVVVGPIIHGTVHFQDVMHLVGAEVGNTEVTVTGIEYKRKLFTSINNQHPDWVGRERPGDGLGIGVLLRGYTAEQVPAGTVLATPNSISLQQSCRCRAYILTAEEGGLKMPIRAGDRFDIYIRVTEVSGTIRCATPGCVLQPGQTYSFDIELEKPMPLEHWQMFAIRSGGRTIGAAVITEL